MSVGSSSRSYIRDRTGSTAIFPASLSRKLGTRNGRTARGRPARCQVADVFGVGIQRPRTDPARFDSVFGQLERGELAVRTDPVDPQAGDPAVGYAVLAGALFAAAAASTLHARPDEIPSLLAAVAAIVQYVRSRR
ncbi:ABC-1 domain-containing protein [Natronococcus jeotgali DSM 18795]|uniref:ABC-1 domain-containing protein n=1 Tax=Natronococcus jeotgali DSM 18795 TaxID=1227498 RepID=L9XYM3_9EURY|nr:ABC-1 domain-containing protein [Natronococcus jeotgali DSM 18795]